MPIRSVRRKPTFDLLAGYNSGDGGSLLGSPVSNPAVENEAGNGRPGRRKRKSKAGKKKAAGGPLLELDVRFTSSECGKNAQNEIGMNCLVPESQSKTEFPCDNTVAETEMGRSTTSCVSYVELRQRYVNGVAADGDGVDDGNSYKESSMTGRWKPETLGSATNLETMKSLDWRRVMAENSNLLGEVPSVEMAPVKYFMGEIHGGNSLRSTISVGSAKKRQRVYNTIFHVPFRCERLIIAGFFVCVDSFLSLLTIMPARIIISIWRMLKTRQFQRPDAAELSDFGSFVVLVLGIAALQWIDISLIYHIIRGQGTLKLYVVYNVLEIFDKLCQSLGEDVLQVMFSSAEGLSNCSTETLKLELKTFIFDAAIAIVAFNILND